MLDMLMIDPGAARHHDSGGGPAPAERPVEIRLDGAREVAVRHLEERRHVRRDPGVVDHHVQSAEVLGHRYRVVDIPALLTSQVTTTGLAGFATRARESR